MSSLTRVYRNLNNGKWSLKQCIDGKWVVVGYCDACVLNEVSPYISAARHAHVRNDNHREVFAWLVGDLVNVTGFVPFRDRTVFTADQFPFKHFNRTAAINFYPFEELGRGFHWVDSGEDYLGSSCAHFTANQEVFA